MIKAPINDSQSDQMYENVQMPSEFTHTDSTNAVLLDALRPLERRLQQRKILPDAQNPWFSPFWFIAETERNVYLWRQGLSLAQKDDYEFWVDVPALLMKRLAQLTTSGNSNPFINPLCVFSCENPEGNEAETSYLTTFSEAWLVLHPHLHALCCVASTISDGQEGLGNEKEKVLLPAHGKPASVS